MLFVDRVNLQQIFIENQVSVVYKPNLIAFYQTNWQQMFIENQLSVVHKTNMIAFYLTPTKSAWFTYF